MPDEEQLRGYAVTLVARTTNEHHLQPPIELPDGITATVDGPEVLLTIPVHAPDARTALATAFVALFAASLVITHYQRGKAIEPSGGTVTSANGSVSVTFEVPRRTRHLA